jgi:hypothetical protein
MPTPTPTPASPASNKFNKGSPTTPRLLKKGRLQQYLSQLQIKKHPTRIPPTEHIIIISYGLGVINNKYNINKFLNHHNIKKSQN